MSTTAILITKDDTFVHIGDLSRVGSHIRARPGAGTALDGLLRRALPSRDAFGHPWRQDLDEFHVTEGRLASADPEVLIARINAAIEYAKQQIGLELARSAQPGDEEQRADLRRALEAPLVTTLAEAVRLYGDLSRHPHRLRGLALAQTAAGRITSRVTPLARPVLDLLPASLTSRLARIRPAGRARIDSDVGADIPVAPGSGGIPGPGSWYHNLWHLMTGTG